MKTRLLDALGCLAFVAVATVCGVEPAFSQQDEGVQAVLDAQADSARTVSLSVQYRLNTLILLRKCRLDTTHGRDRNES